MNQRSRAGTTEGMTLLEVIMALLLLVVGAAGVCSLAASTTRSSGMARLHYQAANIAANRLENARVIVEVQGINGLTNVVEAGTVMDYKGQADPGGKFKRITVVSNSTPTLKELIITVRIKNNRTATFTTNSTECEQARSFFATTL